MRPAAFFKAFMSLAVYARFVIFASWYRRVASWVLAVPFSL